MTFKILYVEDEVEYYFRIKEAIAEYNRQLADPNDAVEGEKLVLVHIETPDGLSEQLDLGFDLVLADVVYCEGGSRSFRLGDILDQVEAWKRTRLGDVSLPVIAYTGTGKTNLRRCLEEKTRLFDLWDKNSAEPAYVAWRFGRLASEVARDRPDSLMQRLVRTMPVGSSWHSQVAEMVEGYNRGCSEKDQLSRMTSAIIEIGKRIGAKDFTKTMWRSTKEWEELGLASSEQMRGHARHVVNVFWLGYYLLHHPDLRQIFENQWELLRQRRSNWELSDGQR